MGRPCAFHSADVKGCAVESGPHERRPALRGAAPAAPRGEPSLLRARRADLVGRRIRPALSRARAAGGGAPRAAHRRFAHPAGGSAAEREVRQGAAPPADDVPGQRHDRRGAGRVRRARPPPARRRSGHLRLRAQARRPRGDAHVRERPLRPRRDPGRRPVRRGRDREPQDHQVGPAAAAPRGALAPRGARGGVHLEVGLRAAQCRARGGGRADLREPPQLGRRVAAPARPARDREAAFVDLLLRRGRNGRAALLLALGQADQAEGARASDQSREQAGAFAGGDPRSLCGLAAAPT